VLVAVDFSESSRLALEGSLALGRKLAAKLLLVHAWNPGGWLEEPALAQASASWLARARESARKRLEAWADESRAGLDHATLGSASERVVRLGCCPAA